MNDLETRLIAALSDTARRNLSDVQSPPPFHPAVVTAAVTADAPARGRWWRPAVAAAVVVAVAVGVLLGVNRLHHAGPARPATAASTQLTFHTVANVSLTRDQLQVTVQTVSSRLAAAGISGASVRSEGSDRLTISGPLTSAERRQLPDLLAAGALQFRALLTEADQVAAGTPLAGGPVRKTDPLRELGFTPPSSPAALAALTSAQRRAVLQAVRITNCQTVPTATADSPIVACSTDGRTRYLLGPAIVAAGQVQAAAAVAPGTVTGQYEWTVDVELKPSAQQSWFAFTSKHNETVAPGAIDNQVADVLDGKVIVASTILSAIMGTTQITGGFTQDRATALATALAGQPLPVSFVP